MSDKELNNAPMKLPPKKRALLEERLLASLADRTQRRIDRAWAEEAEARIDSYDAGRCCSKPLDHVVTSKKSSKVMADGVIERLYRAIEELATGQPEESDFAAKDGISRALHV